MGTRIYLVRHGETEWNTSFRYQGHSDVKLTDNGLKQAEALAERLSRVKVDAIIASDLSRAYETALTIASFHDLPVSKNDQLREANFGVWEGLTYEEISTSYPEILQSWQDNPYNTVIPQGESLKLTYLRIKKALTEILEKNQNKNIAIVAHGGTNRIILSMSLEMDVNNFWKIKQDNTCLNIIDFYEEKSIVSLVNDTSHLNYR